MRREDGVLLDVADEHVEVRCHVAGTVFLILGWRNTTEDAECQDWDRDDAFDGVLSPKACEVLRSLLATPTPAPQGGAEGKDSGTLPSQPDTPQSGFQQGRDEEWLVRAAGALADGAENWGDTLQLHVARHLALAVLQTPRVAPVPSAGGGRADSLQSQSPGVRHPGSVDGACVDARGPREQSQRPLSPSALGQVEGMEPESPPAVVTTGWGTAAPLQETCPCCNATAPLPSDPGCVCPPWCIAEQAEDFGPMAPSPCAKRRRGGTGKAQPERTP